MSNFVPEIKETDDMKVTIQRKRINAPKGQRGAWWQLQLSYKLDGKRRQTVVEGATYREGDAKAELQARQRATAAVRDLQARTTSLADIVADMAARDGLSGTKANLLRRVADILNGVIGGKPVSEVERADISAFQRGLDKYSRNTQKSYLSQFLWVLGELCRDGSMSDAQFADLKRGIRPVAADEPTPRGHLTQSDIDTLFNTPLPEGCSELVADAFMLSYHCGLRHSDIRKLDTSNVDLLKREIKLRMRKTSRRITLPVNDDALEILQRRMPTGLFRELPAQTTKANRELQRWAKAAGVKAVNSDGVQRAPTFHHARHSCASHMLQKGVPLVVIRDVLGHSDITTTQLYADPDDKAVLEAVSGLSRPRQ